jgi:hypothetical protein
VNNKFFFQKLFLSLENIENQIIEIVEVFEKDTIEYFHLINDCLHWCLRKLCIVVQG